MNDQKICKRLKNDLPIKIVYFGRKEMNRLFLCESERDEWFLEN